MVQAALAEEERNRQEAVRKRAEETGDSMWELALALWHMEGKAYGKSGLGKVKVVGYVEVVSGERVEEEEEEEPWGVEG